MGSKELEPWSPRWVRQKLREKNNDFPPNDLNHDEKPPTDVERLVCKCDFDCQSHMSFRPRYVRQEVLVLPSAHLPRKVVSALTFTFHILHIVVINRFIF
jgi:hypothetical protein